MLQANMTFSMAATGGTSEHASSTTADCWHHLILDLESGSCQKSVSLPNLLNISLLAENGIRMMATD